MEKGHQPQISQLSQPNQSQSNNSNEPSNSKKEQSQSQTRESSDEGEGEDIQLDNDNNNDDDRIIDSTLLHWIKTNKLTFIKEILLQQEISLTEIASLSHNQRR